MLKLAKIKDNKLTKMLKDFNEVKLEVLQKQKEIEAINRQMGSLSQKYQDLQVLKTDQGNLLSQKEILLNKHIGQLENKIEKSEEEFDKLENRNDLLEMELKKKKLENTKIFLASFRAFVISCFRD